MIIRISSLLLLFSLYKSTFQQLPPRDQSINQQGCSIPGIPGAIPGPLDTSRRGLQFLDAFQALPPASGSNAIADRPRVTGYNIKDVDWTNIDRRAEDGKL